MKSWKEEQIFNDGDSFFASLTSSMSAAKESIDFETYIFALDEIGVQVLNTLKKAKDRGVRVRLVVDGFGSLHLGSNFIHELNNQGLEVRVYHPISRLFTRILAQSGMETFARFNRRNHRKTCIIDEQIAFVGGMNIWAVHLEKYSGKNVWRDTSVRVVGPGTQLLTEAFELVWNRGNKLRLWRLELKKDTHSLQDTSVRLNDSLSRRRAYHREIITRMLEAKHSIWITTPYFVPDFAFIRAIRFAVEAGVDVRILVPDKVDVPLMKWVNRSSYQIVLRAGGRIFEYLPAPLHAKVMMIDHWITVGTSNRNHRSLLHDLEVDLVLTHPESFLAIQSQFELDLRSSSEMTLKKWNERSWIVRILESLPQFLKRWL